MVKVRSDYSREVMNVRVVAAGKAVLMADQPAAGRTSGCSGGLPAAESADPGASRPASRAAGAGHRRAEPDCRANPRAAQVRGARSNHRDRPRIVRK
jgi:hypothetical protein